MVGGRGSSNRSNDAGCMAFSNFISQMELVNLPLLGREFTWFSPMVLMQVGWIVFWATQKSNSSQIHIT